MNKLETFIQTLPGFCFLTTETLPELIKLDRLCPVLVRCGCKRFTCAAQDCTEMIRAVELAGDYVRDVSLPVGTKERAATWAEEQLPLLHHRAANTKAAGLLGTVPDKRTERHAGFDENDCGGVFDGSRVVSDADPGL